MKKTLTTGKTFAVCLGTFSRAVIGGLVVTYLIKFFNPTETSGLPILLAAGLIGTLRGVGMIFDAITDPLVASWSDKFQSKNGRRIPFIKWSAIPYALTCLLLFFPPVLNSTSWVNIVWVSFMLLCYYMASTLYCVPYMALAQELTSVDTKKRVFYYTIDSLMFVIGSAVIYVLPTMVSLMRKSGMEAITAWQISMAVFAVLGAICAIIPALVIKENEYVEPKQYYKPIFKSLKETFKYKNFTIMTGGYLIMQLGFAFFNTALLYYIETLLGMPESYATIVLAISIVVGVATYPLLNKLVKKYSKKPFLIGACCAYIFIYMGIYFYQPIMNAIGSTACAILIGVLIAFPIACTNIIPPAAFADLSQVDTILTGENRSGMFVAARNFVTKIAQAVVAVIVSYVMYVGATANADGSKYPTVFGVRLTALIAAICIVAAVVLYFFYDDKGTTDTINKFKEQEAAKAVIDQPIKEV